MLFVLGQNESEQKSNGDNQGLATDFLLTGHARFRHIPFEATRVSKRGMIRDFMKNHIIGAVVASGVCAIFDAVSL